MKNVTVGLMVGFLLAGCGASTNAPSLFGVFKRMSNNAIVLTHNSAGSFEERLIATASCNGIQSGTFTNTATEITYTITKGPCDLAASSTSTTAVCPYSFSDDNTVTITCPGAAANTYSRQ